MENNFVLFSMSPEDFLSKMKGVVSEIFSEHQNKKEEKEILNHAEICELLGIASSTLHKWKAQKKIPFRRLGKRVFFNRNEVLASLKDSNYSKYKKVRSL
ncbi:MAG: helix-turn-helix domain-containing protein [Bacteroidota bacterium]